MTRNLKFELDTSLPLWIAQSCDWLASVYDPSGDPALTREDIPDQVAHLVDMVTEKDMPWGETWTPAQVVKFGNAVSDFLSSQMEIFSNPELEYECDCELDEFGEYPDDCECDPDRESEARADFLWEDRQSVWQEFKAAAKVAHRANDEFVRNHALKTL